MSGKIFLMSHPRAVKTNVTQVKTAYQKNHFLLVYCIKHMVYLRGTRTFYGTQAELSLPIVFTYMHHS